MRILLVEDHKPLVKALRQGLEEEGFAVDVAMDGEEADHKASTVEYDVIILDIMLPKVDGLTLLQRWRKKGLKTHVLMLTARDTLVEAPGRFVLCCSPAVARTVERRATDAGVPVRLLGASGTDRFVIEDQVDLPVADLVAKWQQNLPQAFGKATTH